MADLPVASDFNGSTVTEVQFKTAMGLLLENVASRNYADTKKTEAITAAATDATTKANAAQTAATTSAATDATTKANVAKAAANTYTDTELNKVSDTLVSKNLYNPANNQIDKYVSTSNGQVLSTTGWVATEFITATPGDYITISAKSAKQTGLAFFKEAVSSAANVVAYYSEVVNATTAYTVQVPAGANFLVTTVKSSSGVLPTSLQIEKGQVATTYEAWFASYKKIKGTAMPDGFVTTAQLNTATTKQYEVVKIYKNLFDKTKVKDGKYLSTGTSTTGRLSNAAGFGRSDFMPVTPGEYYTVSGNQGLVGIGFYPSNDEAQTGNAISFNSGVLPQTVQAPSGATHMAINLYQTAKPNFSYIQVEKGSIVTDYEVESGTKTLVDAKYLAGTSSAKNKLVISNTGTSALISSKSDMTVDLALLLTKPVTHDVSSVFNFAEDTVDGTIMRTMSDDTAPYTFGDYQIAANHGYNQSILTLAAHGKTDADVGSVWTDGTTQWVIVAIISATKISITSRANKATYSLQTLTHVSGAANTASFTPTAQTVTQLYPVFKNRQLTCSVDNVPTALVDGEFAFTENVTFYESYDILLKTDIAEWLIANGGKAVMQYDAEAAVSVSISYCFDKSGGCVMTSDFLALKNVSSFQVLMFAQSIKLIGSGYFYIPKTLPFVNNGVNLDLSVPTVLEGTAVGTFNIDATNSIATGHLADRVLQLNSAKTYGYALGFLPVLDASPSVRRQLAVNKAIQVSAGRKSYLTAVDTPTKTALIAGDYFSVAAYRKYFKSTLKRTACYMVPSKLGTYLYVDWHLAQTDRVELPPVLAGRAFEVFEKSSNVTVLSKVATSSVVFKVDQQTVGVNAVSNSYAILLFK